jgi:hypothetical protein
MTFSAEAGLANNAADTNAAAATENNLILMLVNPRGSVPKPGKRSQF